MRWIFVARNGKRIHFLFFLLSMIFALLLVMFYMIDKVKIFSSEPCICDFNFLTWWRKVDVKSHFNMNTEMWFCSLKLYLRQCCGITRIVQVKIWTQFPSPQNWSRMKTNSHLLSSWASTMTNSCLLSSRARLWLPLLLTSC